MSTDAVPPEDLLRQVLGAEHPADLAERVVPEAHFLGQQFERGVAPYGLLAGVFDVAMRAPQRLRACAGACRPRDRARRQRCPMLAPEPCPPEVLA
ncbi:MAG TPA: hypothetical protein VET87_02490 [Rubrivivax sp.]|nr:hypothetical protein [Rubrivivax sp.]